MFKRHATLFALGLTLGLSAGSALAAGKLVISNWDGYMPAELPDQFKEATGIEAEVSFHATNEEIMGKVVASGGKGYDVLFVSSPFAEALNKLGLTAPIDASRQTDLLLYTTSVGQSEIRSPALPHPPRVLRGSH